ncbi:ABC transporter family substrate-binding protein [Parafrigoribacterium humi]|jgi:peptide/nickel transport system substrate-binding protein|uniref:ABC transporter family substrate-binding protein n=2 Tax=Bacteria TaxID=2 RepID=UPI0032F04AAA
MSSRRVGSVLACLVVLALTLTGCSAPVLVEGTSITVAASQSFYSYNPKTSYGNSAANSSIVAATNSQFNYYDDVPKLVTDASFGSYQVLSHDPFTVKYTIRSGVTWSDGTPVDAADLLLAWAANSGSLNTKGFDASTYVDQDTGKFTSSFPKDVVYFDGFSGNGLQLVTKTPTIGDGGRSLTLSYDKYFVDWRLVFGVGLPAHVVAGKALGITSHQKAKDALVKAITSDNTSQLAKISRFWNTGFNFTSMPKDHELVVGTGPYTLTGLVANDHATLTANPHYVGDHQPRFEKVTIRFISDPLAEVRALTSGEVDVIAPQAGADVLSALDGAQGITVRSGFDGAYEHLDLQFEHGRSNVFANQLVREAFLKVVPRQQILDELIKPLQKDARLRSSQVFLPGSDGYARAVKVNGSAGYARVDVSEARALLAKAKVAGPQVCILFDPSNPRRVAEFGLIQRSAALAGFVVTDCSSPDWRALLGAPRAYDAALYALRPSTLAITGTAAIFGSGATATNHNYYADPKADTLLDQLGSSTDAARQKELLTKLDTQVWTDAYGVPLYQFPTVTAFRHTVSGVSTSPLPPGVLWNLWAWKPVKAGQKK